jgi:hypothetical protein
LTSFSSDDYPEEQPDNDIEQELQDKESEREQWYKDKDKDKSKFATTASDVKSDGSGNGKEPKTVESDADIIVKLASDACKELFRDQFESPYAAMTINGRTEVTCMNRKRFKNYLGGIFYNATGKVPKSESITNALNILSYMAQFKGNMITLFERVASEAQTNILYDLTNQNWEVIRVKPSGWHLESNPPIVFRRHGNEHAQVYPEEDYPKDIFDQFMELLNIKGEDNKLLMKCYIVTLFIPGIQKPILMLHGEQGAAKSTLQEIIKALVDPRAVATLSFPSEQKEMVQQLSHNYIAYYDNISQIREWISNILCRAVTGSGFSKRQLYTDDDDIIYNYKRAIGFNGINLAATKADILDRGLIISLDRLTEEQQRGISEIWTMFYELRPKLLGYIFDILVKVLDMIENNPVKLGKLPRMAEFAIHGETVSRCMGNELNRFTDAFKKNRELQATQILETSPVAMVLNEFMEEYIHDYNKDVVSVDMKNHFLFQKERNNYTWHGAASELLTQLTIKAMNMAVSTKTRVWPGAPHVLSRRLREVRATLKEIGIEVEFEKDIGSNKTRGVKVTKIPSLPSLASPAENRAQIASDTGDAIIQRDGNSVSSDEVASPKIVLKNTKS